MLGRSKRSRQLDMFNVPLKKLIDPGHLLCQAAEKIIWGDIENQLKSYYSTRGRPSIPPRKVLGLLILKNYFSVSDEKALNIWLENPYWQLFCGEVYFQTEKPFAVSEFTRFRKRIGEAGEKIISRVTVDYLGEEASKTYSSYTNPRKTSIWQRLFK